MPNKFSYARAESECVPRRSSVTSIKRHSATLHNFPMGDSSCHMQFHPQETSTPFHPKASNRQFHGSYLNRLYSPQHAYTSLDRMMKKMCGQMSHRCPLIGDHQKTRVSFSTDEPSPGRLSFAFHSGRFLEMRNALTSVPSSFPEQGGTPIPDVVNPTMNIDFIDNIQVKFQKRSPVHA